MPFFHPTGPLGQFIVLCIFPAAIAAGIIWYFYQCSEHNTPDTNKMTDQEFAYWLDLRLKQEANKRKIKKFW